MEKCGCPIVITSSVCPSVRPSACLSVRPSTLSLCCDNLNTFLTENFQTLYMGNISDKENAYSFKGHYIKGQDHRQLLCVFFYIPFSNATLCCDIWNTFLQRTFKLGQNVCLGKILIKFEYGSSWVYLSMSVHLSVHTFIVR